MQLCADDFEREKNDDYGARSFLHKYTLEFQDLCTVGIVVKAITLLEFEIRITPNYWKNETTSSLPFDLENCHPNSRTKKKP